jgi:hypothetical protein
MSLSASTYGTNERRKVGKQSGGDGAVPSQAEIRWKCAFTYMNAVSRKNLTDARAVDANDVDTASETGGAFGDGRDRARFLPDDSDIHLGRERPPKTGCGTVMGGWLRGSLTPQTLPSLFRDSRADCDARGKHRRAL